MIDYRSILKENSTFAKIHMGPIYEITNSDAEYFQGRQTSFNLNKFSRSSGIHGPKALFPGLDRTILGRKCRMSNEPDRTKGEKILSFWGIYEFSSYKVP